MNGHAHDHQAILEKVERDSPGDEMLCDLADLFKVFGDTTRMRILYALWESEMCVCALAEFLGMAQSAISHRPACGSAASRACTDRSGVMRSRRPSTRSEGQDIRAAAASPPS